MRWGILLLQLVLFDFSFASAVAASSIEWVSVGSAGNPADPQVMSDGTTDYGSVSHVYEIARYETTNAQYADFLNGAAKSDPNGLFNSNMESDERGGIVRTGSSGSYSYAVKPGMGDLPVNWVSFWDGARFANWHNNGGGNASTDSGAYLLTAQAMSENSVTRSPGATIFLPTEDEWYKAAYFNPTTGLYFDFPSGSDVQTACADPGSPNSANCLRPEFSSGHQGEFVAVGSYPNSSSPYGTSDQGGNIWEWNETLVPLDPGHALAPGDGRGIRGGSYYNDATYGLYAGSRSATGPPEFEGFDMGFRVARAVPEPSTSFLLSIGLIGLLSTRRRNAIG